MEGAVNLELEGSQLNKRNIQNMIDTTTTTNLISETLSSVKKSFVCPTCNRGFKEKRALARHVLSVHEKKKPYLCSLCEKTFSLKPHLKQHIEAVHEKKKPHVCPICDHGFSLKKDLKRHIETVHEGKRDFKCSLCEATFSTRDSMNKHTKVIHEKKLPFKCSEIGCDKRFGEHYRLKNHVEFVHEGIRKTFSCNHCGKGLCSNQQLKRHENKFHKGEIIGSHTMAEVDKK